MLGLDRNFVITLNFCLAAIGEGFGEPRNKRET